MNLPPLFWWYGGKYYMRSILLARVPAHRVYVEPFGGAANLLICKPPADVEVYNDKHGDVTHFFRVLRDPPLALTLQALLERTPYARAEFEQAFEPLPSETAFETSVPIDADAPRWMHLWAQLTPAQRRDVERARRFYIRQAQSYNGAGQTWSRPNGAAPRNRARRAQHIIALLPLFTQRFQNVIIENCHWRDLLPDYDVDGAFWYLDPPYVLETRDGGKVYEHEMTNAEHEELVRFLLTTRHAKVLLSGYQHPIYEPLAQNGWFVEQFSIAKRASGRAGRYGTETLWRNYPVAQPALF